MIGHVKSQHGIARKRLLVILAILIAIIGLATAAFLARPKQSIQNQADNPVGYRETADEFMKQLVQNEPNKTFDLMTNAGKEDVGGIDQWQQKVNGSFSKAKTEPVFVGAHDIQDNDGIYAGRQPKLVTYRLQIFNADWEISLTVIKDQNLWRIDRVGTELR